MVKNLYRRRALLAAGALLATHAVPSVAQIIDRVLVVVNDGVITETEYIGAMRRTIAEIRSRGAEIPDRRSLEEQVMEDLILDRIQIQMADRLNINVSEVQVDRALADIARRQNITVDQLVREAGRVGLDRKAYRGEIEKQLRIQRLVDREVRRRITVSDTEIDERVAMLGQDPAASGVEYEISHISLLLDDANDVAERARVNALAEEIQARLAAGESFEELAREFSDSPSSADGGRLGWRGPDNLPDLFLATVRNLDPGQVSDVLDTPGGLHIVRLNDRRGGGSGELVEQWQVRHILLAVDSETTIEQALETAGRLRDRIAQGDSFAELARIHSADANSRVRGGDLGWLSPGDTVPAFEDALRNLPNNQLSEPVETRFGVHLIEVTDRRRQDIGESRLRFQAQQQLQEEKGREAYEQWLRRIRDEAFVKFRVKPG